MRQKAKAMEDEKAQAREEAQEDKAQEAIMRLKQS
jgi:hypothetical protein